MIKTVPFFNVSLTFVLTISPIKRVQWRNSDDGCDLWTFCNALMQILSSKPQNIFLEFWEASNAEIPSVQRFGGQFRKSHEGGGHHPPPPLHERGLKHWPDKSGDMCIKRRIQKVIALHHQMFYSTESFSCKCVPAMNWFQSAFFEASCIMCNPNQISI